jgi:hypothetical protein
MLLGIYDFFERHTRQVSPDTIVYKTYTDSHRRAFWLDLAISNPWSGDAGAVRASRDTTTNRIHLELARTDTITVDLALAQLRSPELDTLILTINRLVEPAFDPNLQTAAEPLAPVIRLLGSLSNPSAIVVLENGSPLPAPSVQSDPAATTIGPLALMTPHDLHIYAVGCQCIGSTGNVDCDSLDIADIGDITALIDHLFISFSSLCCPAESDLDESGTVDISDLTVLIDHLFVTFASLPLCGESAH